MTATQRDAGMKGGLWRERDFGRLWMGTAVSLFGSEISLLAVPLTAVLVLGAGPQQMGLLSATRWLPFLLFGLFAGVWVDRTRRRPLMIWTDLARAVLVASIPVAALAGALRLEQLYVVAFGMGVLSLVFDACYQAYLPSLVRREALVEGNAQLEVARSTAQIGGPIIAGILVQLLTAPVALLVDASSYVVSAAALATIRAPEIVRPRAERRSVLQEVGEGLRWVFGNALLRPIVLNNVSRMFAASGIGALYVLYAMRELGVSPVALGLAMAAGGPGALAAAVSGPAVIARLGPGRLLVVTFALEGFVMLLVPAAGALPAAMRPVVGAVLLGVARCLASYLLTAGSVAEISLRQAITPSRLQGRMNATMRSLNWGTVAIGALVWGALAERIGVPASLIGACGWIILASGWSLFSPLRRLREMPAP